MSVSQECMKANSRQEISMEKAHLHTLITGPTKEDGLMGSFQGTESSPGPMETDTKGSTLQGLKRVEELSSLPTARSSGGDGRKE